MKPGGIYAEAAALWVAAGCSAAFAEWARQTASEWWAWFYVALAVACAVVALWRHLPYIVAWDRLMDDAGTGDPGLPSNGALPIEAAESFTTLPSCDDEHEHEHDELRCSSCSVCNGCTCDCEPCGWSCMEQCDGYCEDQRW